MSINRQNNRSEFDWEREIRRDENRISRYYRELIYCLDLPGEEEIINEQLSGRSSAPVPVGEFGDVLRNRRFFDDDEEDENAPPRQYSPLVNRIDRLAAEWCALCASILDARLFVPGGMGVACAYAKLLARVADFTDADPVRESALRTSLIKRALSDLNELAGVLGEIAERQRSLCNVIAWHINELSQLRENLTDALAGRK